MAENGGIGNENTRRNEYFGREEVSFKRRLFLLISLSSNIIRRVVFFFWKNIEERERKGQGDYFSSFFYFVSFPCAGSNPIMLISNFHPFDSDFHGIGGRQGEGETWLYGR